MRCVCKNAAREFHRKLHSGRCPLLVFPLFPFEFYYDQHRHAREVGWKHTLTAHRTESFCRVLIDPRQEAVLCVSVPPLPEGRLRTHHMERVATFAHQQRAVVSWKFACRTCSVELDATDATNFVFRHIPPPGGDRMPFLYLDLHLLSGFQTEQGQDRRVEIVVRGGMFVLLEDRIARRLETIDDAR